MLRVAVLIPSPPVLVPELCGGSPDREPGHPAAEVPPLRAAVLRAGATLAEAAQRWTVVGVGEHDRVVEADAVGTFRGFGADVRVGLSADATADPDPALPLPVLLGGWLREICAPAATARARIVAADTPPARCRELGARLRAELDSRPGADGVLVVADGAATLTAAAPGYLDERAPAVQRDLDRALCSGDRAALRALDPALCAELELAGRAAYQVLDGLFDADPAEPRVESGYAAAPFGVGYHVGEWWPGGAR
ncbi:class III extradiol ring-cleavage dioxygenase family protein [Nocardia stercoris]|uniref:Uncharacterized protein n=1 Tax=Nocardia stercoris TaxID=2483361 RepID=A0A3M2KSH8_9NOCA|nr:hypothetical protein [Nocardia stercoris]RMI28617.1 hypothetical protein EBN03_29435 [Nocardia stercoris]